MDTSRRGREMDIPRTRDRNGYDADIREIETGAPRRYVLVVPEILRDVAGAGDAPAAEVSFEDVFVARAGEHDTDDIQTALDAGLHVVLAPGVFDLDAPLKITRPGAVLLGLGLASLVAPDTGEPCVVVDDQGGIRLAGVVLQASKAPTAVLLRWGGPGSSENPSVLSDVFARVGGPGSTDVRADVMAEVSASHVARGPRGYSH